MVIIINDKAWMVSIAAHRSGLQTTTVDIPYFAPKNKLGQYHGYWCAGTWRRQIINSNDIDYAD